MAVHDISQEYTSYTPINYGDSVIAEDIDWVNPYNDPEAYGAAFMNKAWHTSSSQWVSWITPLPDTDGASYPGPGTISETTSLQGSIHSLRLGVGREGRY